jgi:hypothetical protein
MKRKEEKTTINQKRAATKINNKKICFRDE